MVGRALRPLYNTPVHPWTVARLTAATGVSRALLARRFTELVGQPPAGEDPSWAARPPAR